MRPTALMELVDGHELKGRAGDGMYCRCGWGGEGDEDAAGWWMTPEEHIASVVVDRLKLKEVP